MNCLESTHAAAVLILFFLFKFKWKDERHIEAAQCTASPSASPVAPTLAKVIKPKVGLPGDDALARLHPSATTMERKRFLVACDGKIADASKALDYYLSWLEKYDKVAKENEISFSKANKSDKCIYKDATLIAIKSLKKGKTKTELPRIIRTHRLNGVDVSDRNGNRIFHLLPAQMDAALAKPPTYALIIVLYLHQMLKREEDERINVCIDVRAGLGWPNPKIFKLIPFIKTMASMLMALFPERLETCIIYPVPSALLWVWKAIKPYIDPVTRDKICLLPGGSTKDSPLPLEEMTKYIEEDVALIMEKARIESFKI